MRRFLAAWPVLIGVVFAQPGPDTEFRETAVAPAFHKADPRLVHFQTFHKQALDDTHTLLLVRGAAPIPGWPSPPKSFWWRQNDLLGLFLMETANPNRVWTLALLANKQSECHVKVERVDKSSIVLSRTASDYGIRMDSMKLFFDVASKRLLGQVEYWPVAVPHIRTSCTLLQLPGRNCWWLVRKQVAPSWWPVRKRNA